MTDTGHKSGVSMARGLLAQIREIFDGDPGVRKVADDPILSAELLLLFRMILADGQVSETEMAVFRRICAQCHVATQFSGVPFKTAWGGRPAFELFEQIRTTMPNDNPGSLPRQQYADVIAYVMRLNGVAPSATELPVDESALRRVLITPVTEPRN